MLTERPTKKCRKVSFSTRTMSRLMMGESTIRYVQETRLPRNRILCRRSDTGPGAFIAVALYATTFRERMASSHQSAVHTGRPSLR